MTVKDVAIKARVSMSTAAAAIRGDASVKPVTAEKVLKVAEQMGYRRNSAAAAMASMNVRNRQKMAKIVILTGYEEAFLEMRENNSALLAVKHAADEAMRLGIRCESVNIGQPENLKKTLQRLEKEGSDGIILGTCRFPLPDLPEWKRFSLISTQESPDREHIDVVRVSQFRTTLKLLEHLQETGFRRIGFFHRHHPVLNIDDKERLGAFTVFDHDSVATKNRIPPIEVAFGARAFEPRVIEWYKIYHPDVIVGFSIQDSGILLKAGIKIPEEVRWVCLHVEEYNRGTAAGLQFNNELAPEYAVRLLMEKIRHGIRGFQVHPAETLIRPALLAGESCPELNGDDDF
jgi:DNA-binding LacI/PurR family transcriptional regulator